MPPSGPASAPKEHLVARVTLYHLTLPRRLPLIEEEGLRTRADLSARYGPPEALDQVAPGRYAHGKRVSGWVDLDHGLTHAELGGGLVSYSVDPGRTLAAPAGLRAEGDHEAYWAAAQPLSAWLARGKLPADLEVHQHLPVRTKHLQLRALRVPEEAYGAYAPLVAAVADADRLSAKALMHLAIIASDGDFDGPAFTAACALAWRDEPDPPGLTRELREVDPDKAVSVVLAEHGALAPELVAELREVLTSTREWSEQQGLDHGSGIFTRTADILATLHDGR